MLTRNQRSIGMADRSGKQVHLAAIECLLLGAIAMVLIGSSRLAAIQTERIGDSFPVLSIQIVRKKGESFDAEHLRSQAA